MSWYGDAWNKINPANRAHQIRDALGAGGSRYEENPYRGIGQSNYGLPGFESQYGTYGRLGNAFHNQQAPQADAANGWRNRQINYVNSLNADAMGNGPSQQLVRMQAQEAADRAQAQQYGMAASARPGQTAMAYRNAALNGANAQSAVGGQAAMAGMQARLGALGQLGGALQGARGQDIQNNQFNANLQYQQMGLNNSSQLEALRQRLMAAQQQQQGMQGYEQNRMNRFNTMMGQPTQGEEDWAFLQGLGNMAMKAKGGGGA